MENSKRINDAFCFTLIAWGPVCFCCITLIYLHKSPVTYTVQTEKNPSHQGLKVGNVTTRICGLESHADFVLLVWKLKEWIGPIPFFLISVRNAILKHEIQLFVLWVCKEGTLDITKRKLKISTFNSLSKKTAKAAWFQKCSSPLMHTVQPHPCKCPLTRTRGAQQDASILKGRWQINDLSIWYSWKYHA